jgi:hypothetical protein
MLESKGCLQLKEAFWHDEETALYQLNVNGICISRRKGKPPFKPVQHCIHLFLKTMIW